MCPKCCLAFPKPWLENASFSGSRSSKILLALPGLWLGSCNFGSPDAYFHFFLGVGRECSLEVSDAHVRHFQAPRSEMFVLKILCNAQLRMLSTSVKPPETCHQASPSSNSIQTKGFPRRSEEVQICLRSPSSKASKLRLMFLCPCMLCF